MGERMSIGREDVLHVARLSELEVAESDLPRLVQQLGRIVAFVDQLNEIPAGEEAPPFLAGPTAVRLRPDAPSSDPLMHPPSRMAPEFPQGLFAVPKLDAMDGAE
jgi:aspartyl/glutamyl-tRNA(Asn/Gln) amidotransferase C subunit